MAFPQVNHVIILGGSLTGLIHACTILTHSPSTKVTILERSPTPMLHNQGAGVGAGSETKEFFDRYVKPGRVFALTNTQRHYLDRKGNTMDGTLENRIQHTTSWDTLYRLLRWRVDGMDADEFFESLSEGGNKASKPDNSGPKAAYQYGCTVTRLEDLGISKGIRVHWDEKSGPKTADADLVIAADGASSTVRKLLRPEIKREYAGYVGLRGTVLETELSESAAAAFFGKMTFFHSKGVQILAYLIPGENGNMGIGHRLLNWVWYANYKDGSPELEDLMTDTDGKRRPITLPPGGMRDAEWAKIKTMATETLPPQYAEAVNKTGQPFVQAITDVITDENMYMNDRLILAGDALAGFRPHTAASTSQASFDALRLGEWMEGKIDRDEYRSACLGYAKRMQEWGVNMGEKSQFGQHPLAA